MYLGFTSYAMAGSHGGRRLPTQNLQGRASASDLSGIRSRPSSRNRRRPVTRGQSRLAAGCQREGRSAKALHALDCAVYFAMEVSPHENST